MYVNLHLQPLKDNIHRIHTNPLSSAIWVPKQHMYKHTYSHTNTKKNSLEITAHSVYTNSVGTSRIWQKKRLRDVIQTIIKTKYASFLAQCRGDQWEIGRDMRNVCFCYRQHTLMFLISLKWMGRSRVLKWKSVWGGGERQINRDRVRLKVDIIFKAKEKCSFKQLSEAWGLVVSSLRTQLGHTPSMSTQTDKQTTVLGAHGSEGERDK